MDQEQAELNRRSSTYDSGDGRSSEEIRRQIERRRADMDQAANALAARLNPHQLADEVATAVKRKLASRGERVRMAIFDSVKENPLPWLLVGGGLGWLVVRARQGHDRSDETALALRSDFDDVRELLDARAADATSRAKDKVADATDTVKEKLAEATDTAKEKLVQATDNTKEKLHAAVETTREKASETKERMSEAMSRAGDKVGEVRQQVMARASQSMDSNPLILGAVVLGVGALVGMAIPTTPVEDGLMGETRDRLLENARGKGQELLDRGKQLASNVASNAADVASCVTEAAGVQSSGLRSPSSSGSPSIGAGSPSIGAGSSMGSSSSIGGTNPQIGSSGSSIGGDVSTRDRR
jgi:hypothetical protein